MSCAHVAGESNVTKNNSVDFKSASLFIPWKHTWAHTSWSRFDSHHTNLRDNPTKFKYFKRGQRRLLFVMMVLTCSILIDREPSFSLLILTYYFRKSISLHLLSICMCVCSLSIACMIVMIRRWESAFPPPPVCCVDDGRATTHFPGGSAHLLGWWAKRAAFLLLSN